MEVDSQAVDVARRMDRLGGEADADVPVWPGKSLAR